jgi:hypothetical protein
VSGAVCPACGVAVVPGYVKCPKCHRPLPRFARNSISPVGGTVVTEKTKSWPIIAIVIGVVVVVFIGWQVKKAFDDYRTKAHHVRDAAVITEEPTNTPAPNSINDSLTANQPNNPVPPPNAAPTVHAEDVAKLLDHNLKVQRLWSTVTVTGDHVDVRSASCADAGMKSTIDAVVASFHAAGLTKLRCVEQSGGVVFSRDL